MWPLPISIWHFKNISQFEISQKGFLELEILFSKLAPLDSVENVFQKERRFCFFACKFHEAKLF